MTFGSLTVLQAGILRPLIGASLEMGLMGSLPQSGAAQDVVMPAMDLPLADAIDHYNLGNPLVTPGFRSGPVDPDFVNIAKQQLPQVEAGALPVRAITSDLLEAVVDTRPSGTSKGGSWFVLENSEDALRVAQLSTGFHVNPVQPIVVSGARIDFTRFASDYYATRLERAASGWSVARQDLRYPQLIISGYAYAVEASGITTLAALEAMPGVQIAKINAERGATRVIITIDLNRTHNSVPLSLLRFATAVLRDVRMMRGYASASFVRSTVRQVPEMAGPPI